MVYKYRVLSGKELLVKGALVALNENAARALVLKKVPNRKNGIKIEIDGKTIFDRSRLDIGTKLFDEPVAKKVDNRPKSPWS